MAFDDPCWWQIINLDRVGRPPGSFLDEQHFARSILRGAVCLCKSLPHNIALYDLSVIRLSPLQYLSRSHLDLVICSVPTCGNPSTHRLQEMCALCHHTIILGFYPLLCPGSTIKRRLFFLSILCAVYDLLLRLQVQSICMHDQSMATYEMRHSKTK